MEDSSERFVCSVIKSLKQLKTLQRPANELLNICFKEYMSLLTNSKKKKAIFMKQSLMCNLTMPNGPFEQVSYTLRKKSTSEDLFWCFRLSQIEVSILYLEGPNSTWKDHDRNIFCPPGPKYSYHGPFRYHLVFPGTE